MSEFTVGGVRYTAGKMSAFDQFHVARKLGPVLLWLGNASLSGLTDDAAPNDKKPVVKLTPEREARAFTQALCSMSAPLSRDDSELAVNLCLSTVQRDVGGDKGWASIRAAGGAWMFQDIELPEMLEIVWHVLKANKLPDFFSASPSAAAGPGAGNSSRPPTSQAAKTG